MRMFDDSFLSDSSRGGIVINGMVAETTRTIVSPGFCIAVGDSQGSRLCSYNSYVRRVLGVGYMSGHGEI